MTKAVETMTHAVSPELMVRITSYNVCYTKLLRMMMTPAGLALFYGGMSRYKNLLNTFGMTFVAYCLGSLIWVTWGYTLAFGPDIGQFVGGLDHLFLNSYNFV